MGIQGSNQLALAANYTLFSDAVAWYEEAIGWESRAQISWP